MKFNKTRALLRIIMLIFVILTALIVLSGCNTPSGETPLKDKTTAGAADVTPAGTEDETKAVTKAKERSLEIALLCKEIYAAAEKTIDEYNFNQTVLSREAVDKIENYLSDRGYPVINSDDQYPAYLENSDCVYKFWETVSQNKDAEQALISISLTGELRYTLLYYTDGQKYRAEISVGWDENGGPVILSEAYMEIMDWELTDNGDFYYQIVYPPRANFDDYVLVRLQPVDQTLYDLTEKYLSLIGYLNNNLFVCEWTSADYGNLSFNDLLEFLYQFKHKDCFRPRNYESVREPYFHSNIPADLFEETILPYFDISLQEFRTRSLYNSEKKIYPWQEICCDNVTYYPLVTPEVIKYQENADGTLTLTVNVRCNDYKTNRLFTHEVVIRPLQNGGHQYLSNQITYKSNFEQPPNHPRLPPQRLMSYQSASSQVS